MQFKKLRIGDIPVEYRTGNDEEDIYEYGKSIGIVKDTCEIQNEIDVLTEFCKSLQEKLKRTKFRVEISCGNILLISSTVDDDEEDYLIMKIQAILCTLPNLSNYKFDWEVE